jgi:hypothetical protein
MEGGGEEEALVQDWFSAFAHSVDELQLQGMGIHVRFGKGRNCPAAERRVKDVKSIWKNFHLFLRGSEPTDLFELHFLCALTEHIIHSRPILIHGGKVYSLNTLLCLMANEGYLAAGSDGLVPSSEGKARGDMVQKVCLRLSQLRTQLTRLIMATQLGTLLDNPHRREFIKNKLSVEDLRVNDVVFDSVGFEDTGSLSGSLARIVALGKSRNHLLISKAMLKSEGVTYKQVCVSRPSTELHFICRGSGHPVAIGELQTFNILKYIPKMAGAPPLWTLSQDMMQHSAVRPHTSGGAGEVNDLSDAEVGRDFGALAGQQGKVDDPCGGTKASNAGTAPVDVGPSLDGSMGTKVCQVADPSSSAGAVELNTTLPPTKDSNNGGAQGQAEVIGHPALRTRRGRLVRQPRRLDL